MRCLHGLFPVSCSQGLLVRTHNLVLLGRDLKDALIPNPAMGRATFHYPSLLHPGNNPFPASSLNPQMNSCSTRTSYLTLPAQRSPCTSETAAELSFPLFVCLLTRSRDVGFLVGKVSPEYLPVGRAYSQQALALCCREMGRSITLSCISF